MIYFGYMSAWFIALIILTIFKFITVKGNPLGPLLLYAAMMAIPSCIVQLVFF